MNYNIFLSAPDQAEEFKEQVSLFNQALSKMIQSGKNWIDQYAVSVLLTLLTAIIVYFIGRKVIKVILKITKRALERSSIEEGAAGFMCTIVRLTSYLVLAIIVAGILGLNTSSLVALLGTAGLSVSLALKGTLSNFAGGLLILVTKPFKVGDYIIVGSNEGTVTKIDIIYTYIMTPDNQAIVLPNGDLSNMELTNTTNEEKRRIDLTIPVAYDSDIDHVRKVLTEVCIQNDMVKKDEPVEVILFEFGDSSLNIRVRVWTETENYWTLKWKLQEEMKKALDQAGIEIPFNQLDIRVIKEISNQIESK